MKMFAPKQSEGQGNCFSPFISSAPPISSTPPLTLGATPEHSAPTGRGENTLYIIINAFADVTCNKAKSHRESSKLARSSEKPRLPIKALEMSEGRLAGIRYK